MSAFRSLFLRVLCTSILFHFSCMMGGTSETGNARIATVIGMVAVDSIDMQNTIVRLVDEDYLPGTDTTWKVFATSPDSIGCYRFDSIPWGNYYIYAAKGTKRLLRGPLDISIADVEIGKDTLLNTAKVIVTSLDTSLNFAYVRGTVEEYRVDSNIVVMDVVPTGQLEIVSASDRFKKSPSKINSLPDHQIVSVLVNEQDSIVTTNDNDPPVIAFGSDLNTIVSAGSLYRDTLHATDLENDPINFQLFESPTWMTIDSLEGDISGQIPELFPDTVLRIGAIVSDKRGASRTHWWVITIVSKFPIVIINTDSVYIGDTVSVKIENCFCSDSSKPRYIVDWGDGDTVYYNLENKMYTQYAKAGVYPVNAKYFCDSSLPAYEKYFPVDTVYVFGTIFRDTVPPIITLLGGDTVSVDSGAAYVEPGFYATDNIDSSVNLNVTVSGTINTLTPGVYIKLYSVKDMSGNQADKIRFVVVTHLEESTINPAPSGARSGFVNRYYTFDIDTILQNDTSVYRYVWGNNDTSSWLTKSSVSHSWSIPGVYSIQYQIWNLMGQYSQWSKPLTIEIISDSGSLPEGILSQNPVVTGDTVYLEMRNCLCQDSVQNPVYTIYWGNGDTISAVEDTIIPYTYTNAGTYDISAQYTCDSGVSLYQGVFYVDSITVLETLSSDTLFPMLTLIGADTVQVDSITGFVEPGYSAYDSIDGNITSKVIVDNPVNITVPGYYYITYSVTNSSGYVATRVRLVIVE